MTAAEQNAGTAISATTESRNLDFLRAVAVSCVCLAHLFLFLIKFKYVPVGRYAALWDIVLNYVGHLGVLFFFVHTALVLMLSLDRTKGPGLFVNFYIRRFFRIYPLYIACIAAILLLKVPQVPDGTFVSWEPRELLANIFLVQNIFRKPDLIMPFWTLTRESQMYLVLPLIYLLLKKLPSAALVLVLWVSFFGLMSYTDLFSCFPCFLGGVFAYQLAKERVFRLPANAWPAVVIGLSAVTFVVDVTLVSDYRSDYVLCAALGMLIPNFLDLKPSWLTQASHVVAKYSYGIYLCHDPVIWWSFTKLKSFPVSVQYSVFVLLMAAVPWAAYRFIESPLIEHGRRLAGRWSASHAALGPTANFLQEAPQLAE